MPLIMKDGKAYGQSPSGLSGLIDTNISSPTAGQVIQRNANNDAWVNANLPTVDSTLNTSSDNAIANSAVATALSGKQATMSRGNTTGDANSITAAGYYRNNNNSISNCPNGWGILICTPGFNGGTSAFAQFYVSNDGNAYVRANWSGGSWSNWKSL